MATKITNPTIRLQICEKCPHLSKVSKVCKRCNCAVKSKVHKNTTCPLGKW